MRETPRRRIEGYFGLSIIAGAIVGTAVGAIINHQADSEENMAQKIGFTTAVAACLTGMILTTYNEIQEQINNKDEIPEKSIQAKTTTQEASTNSILK